MLFEIKKHVFFATYKERFQGLLNIRYFYSHSFYIKKREKMFIKRSFSTIEFKTMLKF